MLSKRPRRVTSSILMAATAIISACTDLPVGPTQNPQATAPSQPRQPGDYPPIAAMQAFRIDLRADGPFVPGQPIRVEANVASLIGPTDATISIAAPELTIAAQTTAGAAFAVPLGVRIPPVSNRSARVTTAAERVTATIVAPAPGYYRIVASAVVPGDSAMVRNGRLVQTTVHRELWLLIADEGGRTTPLFDEGRIPPDAIPQPGPWRPRRGGRPDDEGAPPAGPAAAKARAGNEVALYSGDGHDYYQIVYWNQDANAYVAVPQVYIEVRTYREEYGNTVLQDVNTAGGDNAGGAAIWCGNLPDGQWYEIAMRLQNDKVAMSNTGQFGFHSGGGGEQCGAYRTPSNPETVIAPSLAAHVYRNFTFDIEASRQFFQRSRGQLSVKVYDGNEGGYYSGWWDEVKMWSNASWGSFGRFTAGHEYGHAFHEKGLGGNAASGECPSPHFNGQRTNLACALSEGFATYHANAIGATFFNLNEGNFTVGCISNGTTCSPGTILDGSVVEGAVAAFFFNLTDPPGSTNDPLQYPGVYVADIMRTCVLGSFPRRIDGVDFATYCMEQQVDPTIKATFFTTRSGSVTLIGESASEPSFWNGNDIRNLWKWNLYRNTAPPPPPPPSSWANIQGNTAGAPGQFCYFYAQTNVADAQFEWRVNGATVGSGPDLWYSAYASYTLELQVWNGSGSGASDYESVTIASGQSCDVM